MSDDAKTSRLLEEIAHQLVVPVLQWLEKVLPSVVSAIQEERPTWHLIEEFRFILPNHQVVYIKIQRYDVLTERKFYRTLVDIYGTGMFGDYVNGTSHTYLPEIITDMNAVALGRDVARAWLLAICEDKPEVQAMIRLCLPEAAF